MKNFKNMMSKFSVLLMLGLILAMPACTDLEEEIYSQVTPDNFYQTPEEFISALGSAYSALSFIGNHRNLWSSNELSTDECIVATKGGDWFDGGQLIQIHRHQFQPDNPFFNDAWNALYNGIGTTNRLIFQFEELVAAGNPEAEAFIAELRGIRALLYYWAVDAFGNVPLAVDFTDESPPANNADFAAGRQEVYNFIEGELNEIIPLLDPNVGGAAYGRMNQAAALALRTKLYLNAEVFTGTPQWEKVIADADAIMGYGFTLAGDYHDNFIIENQTSPENIFVVPYDKVFASGFNWAMMHNHLQGQVKYNFTQQPWNGYATIEEFYMSYVDPAQNPGPQGPVWVGLADFDPNDDTTPNGVGTLDARLGNFQVGPQFALDGSPLEDPGFEGEGTASPDPDGPRINFTPRSNEIFPNGWRQGGARNQKYEYEIGGTDNMSNDFVIFRLADIMLSKAEALWQLDNGSAEALDIVNQIRVRSGVDPFPALTADLLFAERGREMYLEMTRRQDQIRFGKFGDAWWEKEAYTQAGSQYLVFPIPQVAIDASAALNQNPGY